jgi:hypothetical protein
LFVSSERKKENAIIRNESEGEDEECVATSAAAAVAVVAGISRPIQERIKNWPRKINLEGYCRYVVVVRT